MKRTSWWKRLFWICLGAIISQLVGPHVETLADKGYDRWCGGQAALQRGKAMLKSAIRLDQTELYPKAKVAFEASASCSVPEANFFLGLMYCNGFGVSRNRPHGMQLIRRAASREAQWAMEILADPTLCSKADEMNGLRWKISY